MKVTVTSTFPLRGQPISSTYSFPEFSTKIEEIMSRELEFLKKYPTFSLEMKIEKSS